MGQESKPDHWPVRREAWCAEPRPRLMNSRSFSIVLAAIASLTIGCVERRVVRSTDMLAGLPGAEGGQAPVRPGVAQGPEWDQLLAQFEESGADDDPNAEWLPAEGQHLREVSRQGDIRLISQTPSHVMFHLTQTLRNDEFELLRDQVLSERTRRNYAERGRDPMEAVAFLNRNEQAVADLFGALPLGEQTPGVLLENIGPNAFRLRAPPAMAPDLRFTQFDVIIERGTFRLLMIR